VLTTSAQSLYRPAGSGVRLLGPGDWYRFLVTGEESGDAYFAMEAFVPPDGGPPLHIHRNEDETFYVVEGRCAIRLGDERIDAGPGDFVNVPRGVLHNFHNDGDTPMRMILTFTPAGIEHFFEESLDRATDASAQAVGDPGVVGARYVAAAPRYGLEFVDA
jgi:quercetin dioxygenase-like cupin family protein